MENIMKYIKAVTRTVTALAGRGCSCKFTLEDKHGKYQGYKPHDNWELWYQDHSDSDFEYFLKCIGCGYELAKKYWKDSDGTFVDYTDGIADSFWKCPTVDSRKFPSKESAQADFEYRRDTTEWTKKQWIQFLNRIDSDSPTPEECIYLRNEIKRKEL
jgi:hypothetical protein